MPGIILIERKTSGALPRRPAPTVAGLRRRLGHAAGRSQSVVVATTGDAASRQGECYEAIAFAVERKLPIVILIEDNNYGISTNTEKFNPFKLNIFNEDFVVHVDARDPAKLAPVARQAIRQGSSWRGADGCGLPAGSAVQPHQQRRPSRLPLAEGNLGDDGSRSDPGDGSDS